MGGLEGCIGLPALQPLLRPPRSHVGGEGYGHLLYQNAWSTGCCATQYNTSVPLSCCPLAVFKPLKEDIFTFFERSLSLEGLLHNFWVCRFRVSQATMELKHVHCTIRSQNSGCSNSSFTNSVNKLENHFYWGHQKATRITPSLSQEDAIIHWKFSRSGWTYGRYTYLHAPMNPERHPALEEQIGNMLLRCMVN